MSERSLLALDTSGERYIVALIGGDRIMRFSAGPGNDRAWGLSSESARLLSDCGITARDLSCVACGLGPGTFIGTRSGISFANGIGQTLGLPLFGFSSLDALAIPHIGEDAAVVALKRARKPSLFCSLYPPQLLKPGVQPSRAFGDEIVTWEQLMSDVLPHVLGGFRLVLSGCPPPDGIGLPVVEAHIAPPGLLHAAVAASVGEPLPMLAPKYLAPPV